MLLPDVAGLIIDSIRLFSCKHGVITRDSDLRLSDERINSFDTEQWGSPSKFSIVDGVTRSHEKSPTLSLPLTLV